MPRKSPRSGLPYATPADLAHLFGSPEWMQRPRPISGAKRKVSPSRRGKRVAMSNSMKNVTVRESQLRRMGASADDARHLHKAMRAAESGGNAKDADRLMQDISVAVDGHGVEAIRGSARPMSRYFVDIVALYVNTGDTYNNTIVYDTVREKFIPTTMGDFVERYSRKYGID